jgi:hypothetical protein
VFDYERTHGGDAAAPGSKQWNQDAQRMLGDSGALQTARAEVAQNHVQELPGSGLNVQRLGAQEWAGESVGGATLRDPQTSSGSAGRKPTLTQRQQGEQGAARSLSGSLSSLPRSGVDPGLARQALFDNGYVGTLGLEIAGTMQDTAKSHGHNSADGIGYLYHTVGGAGFDPQLATSLMQTAQPQVQAALKKQPKASVGQAAQAYVYTGGLYDVALNARQAGVAGASDVAKQLAQSSYTAANTTDSRVGRGSINDSKLDKVLSQVQDKTQQQHMPANLLQAWGGLSQGVTSRSYANDNVGAWSRFRTSVSGNAQLKAQPLTAAHPLVAAQPGLSADQVHGAYDTALGGLSGQQQNGGLVAGADPTVLAAIQTQMLGGYGGTGNQDALARAMIAGRQPQLQQSWQQQNPNATVLMPVNDLTAQAGDQIKGLGSQIGVGADWSTSVSQGVRGMQATPTQAPSGSVVRASSAAYQKLQAAQASGDKGAISQAQAREVRRARRGR